MSEKIPQPLHFQITTMGCKVNTYDTSLLEQKLAKVGFVPSSGDESRPRIHVINSCAVTEKSSLETHKFVKRIKAHEPDSVVVITGCVAQVDVDRLRNLTGADLIIGNSHKTDFEKIVHDFVQGRTKERIFHSNIFKKEELDPGGGIESSRTRAFLKIQDGCNSFCSFCIIPFARGKSRSLSRDHLIERVRGLYNDGFREVVLTGVHCGDYDDKGHDFAQLVEDVLEQTPIPRVRLSSLEPIEVSEKLWSLYQTNERLCPHIHVSLQSANTQVLSQMRRKYGQEEIRRFFSEFKQKVAGGFIGMDVIVGFPGESEREFDDTYEFLKSQDAWTRIHVFPYSIRPGTTAAKRTDHLAEGEIRRRSKCLRMLSLERQTQKAQAQVGTVKKVLILEKPSSGAQGLSRDYWPVQVRNIKMESFINQEVEVEITGSEPLKNSEAILIGRVAKIITM